MDLSVVSNSSRELGRFITKNSPTILTALGVTGLFTSIALAIRATPKALEILEMEEKFRLSEVNDRYYDQPIEMADVIRLTWKEYVPAAAMALTTTACIIGANSIHLRRNAALVSLFSITETALKEYQVKVVEKIGENKEEKIRGEMAQDKIDANPLADKAVVVTTRGSMLCYDNISGRYFYSDVESLRRAQNDFNDRLIREMAISLNEFYDDIGLDPIDIGSQTGWTIEKGMMNLYLGSAKMTKDGQPCIVVEHRNLPTNLWG
jgi:uncharacterized protein DUF6353